MVGAVERSAVGWAFSLVGRQSRAGNCRWWAESRGSAVEWAGIEERSESAPKNTHTHTITERERERD
jgi:hypothetical protein